MEIVKPFTRKAQIVSESPSFNSDPGVSEMGTQDWNYPEGFGPDYYEPQAFTPQLDRYKETMPLRAPRGENDEQAFQRLKRIQNLSREEFEELRDHLNKQEGLIEIKAEIADEYLCRLVRGV